MGNKISGTKEWAVKSVNCVDGCSHDCLYCYARHNAVVRFKKIPEGEWHKMIPHQPRANYPKYNGRVMFPTQHDITPEVLSVCMSCLEKLLLAENEVLIVSKPHLTCIERICTHLVDFKQHILFRFTIGCDNNSIMKFWEPGAPDYKERILCLEYAYNKGFQTSVSVEPMLNPKLVSRHIQKMLPFITDAIWVGKMNRMTQRVQPANDEVIREIQRIEREQCNKNIIGIYSAWKNEPKVRWKESIKEIVGIDLATKAGEDK